MNKKKQIEEMAHNLCLKERDCEDCECNGVCLAYSTATIIYNAGYRKIPEGAVVLTKEEQEKRLKATEKNIKQLKEENDKLRLENNDIESENEKLKNCNDKLSQGIYYGNGEQYRYRLEQARKETEREILSAMIEFYKNRLAEEE